EMVERLKKEVIDSKSDAQAALHWNQFYYVRYQNILYRLSKRIYLAEKLNPVEAEQEHSFKLQEEWQGAAGLFHIESKKIGLSHSL
ncbi:tRNA(Ile)-lysidine synthetase, partial [Acinetobacter baumannii]